MNPAMQIAVEKCDRASFRLSRWVLPSVLFLPSLVMVGLMQSSMAAGLILCMAGLSLHVFTKNSFFLLRWPLVSIKRTAVLWLLLSAFILVHGLIRIYVGGSFGLERFISGYIIFAWMAGVAAIFALVLPKVSPALFSRQIDVVMGFLFVNALIGLTGVGLLPGVTHKPVGIFAEPSHFALVLAPVMAYGCISGLRWSGYAVAFFFLWGIFIQNLTILMVCLLCLVLILRFDWKLLIIPVGFASIFMFTDMDYFLSRLVISAESDNQSVLVLLQGWETADLLMERTRGWGAGFQQFGVVDAIGEVGEKVEIMSDGGVNLFDGGSSAAKIVGEFGYTGVVFVSIYIGGFLFSLKWLRRMARVRAEGGGVFLMCVAFMFFVEMFARGAGYFSPTFFLLLSSAFWAVSSGGRTGVQRKLSGRFGDGLRGARRIGINDVKY